MSADLARHRIGSSARATRAGRVGSEARRFGGMERSVLAVEIASEGRLWSSQRCAGGVRCGHRSLLGPATAQPPGSRLSLEVT
jgi:hypothetical protein